MTTRRCSRSNTARPAGESMAVLLPSACTNAGENDVVLATHSTVEGLSARPGLVARWAEGSDAGGACGSVAVALCSSAEWAQVVALWAGSELLRDHVVLHVVMGASGTADYPVNVLRNAAQEPWTTSHAARLRRVEESRSRQFRARTEAHAVAIAKARGRAAKDSKCAYAGYKVRPNRLKEAQLEEIHTASVGSAKAPVLERQRAAFKAAASTVGAAPWVLNIELDMLPSVGAKAAGGLTTTWPSQLGKGDTPERTLFVVMPFETKGARGRSLLPTFTSFPPEMGMVERKSWLVKQVEGSLLRPYKAATPISYLGMVPLNSWLRPGSKPPHAAGAVGASRGRVHHPRAPARRVHAQIPALLHRPFAVAALGRNFSLPGWVESVGVAV